MTMHPINWRTARNTRTYVQVLIEQQQHFGSGIEQQPIVHAIVLSRRGEADENLRGRRRTLHHP